MQHCEDDALSLIALGESPTSDDETHLDACPRCHSRLDQLRAVVASSRAITDADRPVAPPARVWDAITAELAADTPPSVIPIANARRARDRGRRVWLVGAAAAFVGVIAGGAATAALLAPRTSAELVASASLQPIDAEGISGSAAVEQRADGAVLTVSVPGLPDLVDGYYEVWMATPDTSTMVAIGTLAPGQDGTFTLPPGMSVADFPVVDVSIEHFDGDAGHGVESVVRGSLQT